MATKLVTLTDSRSIPFFSINKLGEKLLFFDKSNFQLSLFGITEPTTAVSLLVLIKPVEEKLIPLGLAIMISAFLPAISR